MATHAAGHTMFGYIYKHSWVLQVLVLEWKEQIMFNMGIIKQCTHPDSPPPISIHPHPDPPTQNNAPPTSTQPHPPKIMPHTPPPTQNNAQPTPTYPK